MKKLFLVATAIVLAGCSSQTANPQPSDSPGGTVTVIAHDSFVMTDQQINDFKAATGITIELIQAGDAGTMVSSAILTAGSPSADVMFGIDNTLSAKAVNSGVFEPYESQASGTFKSEFQNLTAGGHLTPVDFGDVCVNFDKKFFAANSLAVPTSLADLTSKQYSGLLVTQDPGTSSPGLAFLLATIATFSDEWPTYWEQLRANNVKVAGSWSDAYFSDFTAGGGNGAYPLVVSYATSPAAEAVYAETELSEVGTGSMTAGCFRQIEFAGILRGSDNVAASKLVVDFLVSKEFQSSVAESMFVYPVRQDVALPDAFTRFAAEVRSPLSLPSEVIDVNLDAWLTAWDAVMKN